MPSRCVVGGCSNITKKGIKLHTIPYFNDDRPIAKARRKRWVDFVLKRRAKWTPTATSAICSKHFSPEDYSQRYSFGEDDRKLAHLVRDETGIVPYPKIYPVPSTSSAEANISQRNRRKILRDMVATSTGDSREAMGPVREPENEDMLSVENVEEPDTVTSAEDCCSARDFSTQTPDCLACKKLKEEKRLLHNKCIDLKNKIDSLTKEPTLKSSCGIQCDLTQPNDHEEGLGERIGENLEEDDEYVNMELEEDNEDTVDYDITEEEPESIPDDVDYHPYTDTETETETEDEEHMTGKRFNSSNYSTRTEPKYIVFLSKLLLLFSFCHSCKTENPVVTYREVGTMVKITTTCQNPRCPKKENTWRSQPNMTGTKIPAGNILLCFAVLTAGASASKVFRLFQHMGVACITLTTFFKHQGEKLFPSILLFWKKYQKVMLSEVQSLPEPLTLSGDARHDSMGHSAKFGVYSIFLCNLPNIIHFSLVQRNETGSSAAMEYVGFKRSINFLLQIGLTIGTFISDRHLSIAKHMREKLPNITHYFDLWHLKKSVKKALNKVAREKGCELIKDWIQPCLNHLHWSATSTICGTGRIIWSKFNSFKSHILNRHKDLPDPLFNKCAHANDITPRKWLIPDSVAYEKLDKALNKKGLIAGIKQASPLSQTSCLEGFHSLLNQFCPKMIAFSFPGMYCRQILAVSHFNYNIIRETKKKPDGSDQVRFIYPKFKNGEATVRDVRIKPDYGYVEEIYNIFLEALQKEDLLREAKKELKEMTPPPMNTMLVKESKTVALEKKEKRKSMVIDNVPPTTPLSQVLELEAKAAEMKKTKKIEEGRIEKSIPHCTHCKNPMKGHKNVKDCPKNQKSS